ncbi:hypothetical protein HQ487_05290 [Candidatus Uhrbacteria bacterium]|nr:hypothetical protein [Candidatus Uhrbacteria bacterium]
MNSIELVELKRRLNSAILEYKKLEETVFRARKRIANAKDDSRGDVSLSQLQKELRLAKAERNVTFDRHLQLLSRDARRAIESLPGDKRKEALLDELEKRLRMHKAYIKRLRESGESAFS